MPNSDKIKGIPWFPICTGLFGLVLQILLLSTRDGQGLLPEHHISSVLSFVLFALTLAGIFLGLRKLPAEGDYCRWFSGSAVAGVGAAVGAVGMSLSALSMRGTGILLILLPVFAAANMGAMLLAAFSRFKGVRPNCLLYVVSDVFLILRIMVCCQGWGRESQMQTYFFPLIASLFLLLACYYRAERIVKEDGFRPNIFFFSQAALFCCLLALPGDDWLFYLSAAVWMATDFSVPADQTHLSQ